MKKVIFSLFILTTFSLHADGEIYYTILPNLSYFAGVEQKQDNDLKTFTGAIPQLIEDLMREKNLTPRALPFSSAQEAIDSATTGYGSNTHSLDVLAGVYYDEKIAPYMEYIYPPLFEDSILLVLPKSFNFSLTQLADFQSLDAQLTAVVIEGMNLGAWWESLAKDKQLRWREHVVSKTQNQAKPLHLIQAKTIDDAMILVLKGQAYFVGSGLMMRDYLSRHPNDMSQIIGQYIKTENGDVIKRPLFITVNRDFLDLFPSLNFEQDLSEKVKKLKKSGDIEKRLKASK